MRMERGGFRTDHLTFGVLAGITISCIIPIFLQFGIELAFPLLVFNIFYVFLTFPLNVKLTRKLNMLLIGNLICVSWNQLFILFATVAAEYFGSFFEALFIILNPFLNLIWIVSFWSTSLTLLNASNDENLRRENVD
ncbi:MAG: hypothetical protein ACUVT9_04070 [Candidatus Bathycorpusculaceae bacterium]